jgi:hypothetical protein
MGPSFTPVRLSRLPACAHGPTVCLHPSREPEAEEDLGLSPALSASVHAVTLEAMNAPLPQGSSAPGQVMLSCSIIAYTTPCASPMGTLRFRGIALIRSAFAVRERLGDPWDLPYFHCCSFHACHRPYPGGSADSFPVKQPAVPDFLDLGASRHPPHTASASNLRRGVQFRGCIVRFMLRPACLPSPPDWLRQDEVTHSSPCLLRYIVTPAFGAIRYRAALGVRLNGRTRNLPLLGLSPNQFAAASEAAP